MALNATAALAAGVALGLDPQLVADGLARYTGVRRRFEYKGRAGGVVVYDDYAHHPTEVAAQLRRRPLGGRHRPAGRGLPAASVLAHPDVRRGVRRRAVRRRRRGADGRLRRPGAAADRVSAAG